MLPWWREYLPQHGDFLLNEDLATLVQRTIQVGGWPQHRKQCYK
jgi:hypothetical protein